MSLPFASWHAWPVAGVVALFAAGPADEPRVDLPADTVYASNPDSPAPVVFRHWTHVALQGGRCDGCHVGLFRMLEPTRRTSHEAMDAGRDCGACHDGTRAFATSDADACLSCHGDESPFAPLPPAPGGRLLGASRLSASEDSPGPVRFDHRSHLATGLVCTSCHPALAPMRSGSAGASKEAMLSGASCGACHDGQRAFGVDDDRCDVCHVEEEP